MKIVTWVIPYARDGPGPYLCRSRTWSFHPTVYPGDRRCVCLSVLGLNPSWAVPHPAHSTAPHRCMKKSSGGFCWCPQAAAQGRTFLEATAQPAPTCLMSSSWLWYQLQVATWWHLVTWALRSTAATWLGMGQRRWQQPGIRARRHRAGFEDKAAAAMAWEKKWLESVKAVDRGGRGWVVGREKARFKVTGTSWFMLTRFSSRFGKSANKLGHLMQALLRETWKNG